jgi:hypothetical protein
MTTVAMASSHTRMLHWCRDYWRHRTRVYTGEQFDSLTIRNTDAVIYVSKKVGLEVPVCCTLVTKMQDKTITQILRKRGTVHIFWGCKSKAIPVTGRGGPCGCETSRLAHFLDNLLTDGGKVVSPTRRPPFIPTECS